MHTVHILLETFTFGNCMGFGTFAGRPTGAFGRLGILISARICHE